MIYSHTGCEGGKTILSLFKEYFVEMPEKNRFKLLRLHVIQPNFKMKARLLTEGGLCIAREAKHLPISRYKKYEID